jgi:hypothetical protein
MPGVNFEHVVALPDNISAVHVGGDNVTSTPTPTLLLNTDVDPLHTPLLATVFALAAVCAALGVLFAGARVYMAHRRHIERNKYLHKMKVPPHTHAYTLVCVQMSPWRSSMSASAFGALQAMQTNIIYRSNELDDPTEISYEQLRLGTHSPLCTSLYTVCVCRTRHRPGCIRPCLSGHSAPSTLGTT